jgi:hypothetical protein
MKRHFVSVALFSLSAIVLCLARVTDAMATAPTEVVAFVCADYAPFTVQYYDHSSGAPAQPSGSCSAVLEYLLNAGLTNVNVSVQTYASSSGEMLGAPGGVNGSYIT